MMSNELSICILYALLLWEQHPQYAKCQPATDGTAPHKEHRKSERLVHAARQRHDRLLQ
jgi:hypothetical protein